MKITTFLNIKSKPDKYDINKFNLKDFVFVSCRTNVTASDFINIMEGEHMHNGELIVVVDSQCHNGVYYRKNDAWCKLSNDILRKAVDEK